MRTYVRSAVFHARMNSEILAAQEVRFGEFSGRNLLATVRMQGTAMSGIKQRPVKVGIRGTAFRRRLALSLVFGAVIIAMIGDVPATADPCGMVPPIKFTGEETLVRIDIQRTYVCFDRGIESIVLRPGFRGSVADFGMLIPFPQPPEIRKVDDNIFHHIAAAIDPPEVEIDLTPPSRAWGGGLGGGFGGGGLGGFGGRGPRPGAGFGGLGVISKEEVKVVKVEAVGMYEVAVLAAGSAEALNRWMADHGYRYPTGMDEVCNEYIEQSWGFVAVKTSVASKATTDPQPGQREVQGRLPQGSGFEGHVQAMGFRFHSEELVVPMRLSAFNEGELRNVVYLLTEGPKAIRDIPEEYVVRQVAGKQLVHNLTELLPLRVIGGEIDNGRIVAGTLVSGTVENLTKERLAAAKPERDPEPYNGLARHLFTSDMLSIGRGQLLHSFEERTKQLANISTNLGINDSLVAHLYEYKPTEGERQQGYDEALEWLERMTMTVVDGDFPRDVLAHDNLTFKNFRMPGKRNHTWQYNARYDGPHKRRSGVRIVAAESAIGADRTASLLDTAGLVLAGTLALGFVALRLRRASRRAPKNQAAA